MSAIFISHSSADDSVATELKSRLNQEGYPSVFLDFDPVNGIPAGRNWERELYENLRRCRAMVVLCSGHSLSSRWCFAELTLALALGKEIFPVKISACTLPAQLTTRQVVDLTGDREQGYERLFRGLADVAFADYVPGVRSPYPGLAVFREEDAPLFFGRERNIQECLELLRRLRDFGGPRLVLILGASGCGKSSLVRAGVVPALRRHKQHWLVIGPIRPASDRLDQAVARTLDTVRPSHGHDGVRTETDGWWSDPHTAWPELLNELPERTGKPDAAVLVFIDQFEELLDGSQSGDRAAMADQVSALARAPDCRAIVVATLRSDFLGEFQQHPSFREVHFEQVLVGPLTREGFVRVIEGPAELENLELESGLVPMIVGDTETGDALPLLAFALSELWERYGQDGRWTIDEYRDLGRLDGSVARAAEAALNAESLSEAEQPQLRNVFIAMVRIDEQGRCVRRPVRWASISSGLHPLLQRLIAKRLLVSKTQDGERVVEVAHESLFRTWTRLRAWLDEDRENLRLREGLRRAAVEWDVTGRSEDLLNHRGLLLQAAERLAAEPRFALDAVETAYFKACVQARDRERHERERREQAKRRRVRLTISGLTVSLALISGFGLWAASERNAARDRLSGLHWANGVFERDRGGDRLKASHHFVQAAELIGEELHSRNAYLAGALLTRGIQLHAVFDHGPKLQTAIFGGEPNRIWSWGDTGTGRLWQADDGASLGTFHIGGNIQTARASPKGRWIWGVGGDNQLRMVDGRTGHVVLTVAQPGSSAAFNDDETKAAIWARSGSVRLYDLTNFREIGQFLTGYTVLDVFLSRTGERVVMRGEANVASLRDHTGKEVCNLSRDEPTIHVVFSADDSRIFSVTGQGKAFLWESRGVCRALELGGRALAAGLVQAVFANTTAFLLTWNHHAPGDLHVWDAASGRERRVFRHKDAVTRAVLSSDEKRALTASDDGTARVWDLDRGEQLLELSHGQRVRGAIYAQNELRILSWSDDHSARVWNAATGEPVGAPLRHAGPVLHATFSGDGRNILTRGEDGVVRLWSIEDRPHGVTLDQTDEVLAVAWDQERRKISVLTADGHLSHWLEGGEQSAMRHLAAGIIGGRFARDGSRLLTWDLDHNVRLWDASDGQPMGLPVRHEASDSGVRGAAFSPDERWVISWGGDRTARVWDSATGKPLFDPLQHGGEVLGAVVAADKKRIVTWSDEQLVRVWDTARPAHPTTLELPSGIGGAWFGTERSTLLTWSTDGWLRLWDLDRGVVRRDYCHGSRVLGAEFSRDHQRILSWGDDGTARVWDAAHGGKELSPAIRHGATAAGGALLSPDESGILTWADDGSARLWDSRNAQPLTTPLRHGGSVQGAAWSADGERLITWGGGALRVWPLDTPARRSPLLQQEVRTGTRLTLLGQVAVLSPDEWRKAAAKLSSEGAPP